ncbi:hypothetical protein EZS27_016714, partial [termite gut metagenome]
VPFLLSHTEVNPEQIDDNGAIYSVHSIDVPQTIEFAGQRVDLARYDCRERMDRELMAFTYMHSSTMLMIKRANNKNESSHKIDPSFFHNQIILKCFKAFITPSLSTEVVT